MMRLGYKSLLLLMWLALVTSALHYWRAWDQLPDRMAVHFDANWQPNGYTSKAASVELGLGIMAVMLVLFSVAGLIAHALRPGVAWPILVVFYLVLAVIWYGDYPVVKFNLNAQQVHSQWMGVAGESGSQFLVATRSTRVSAAQGLRTENWELLS
jgi:uncharacterized membrane protein